MEISVQAKGCSGFTPHHHHEFSNSVFCLSFVFYISQHGRTDRMLNLLHASFMGEFIQNDQRLIQ